ncbi:MAG: hybrid sensor histidine kinase/response regulator [Desulfococcaceae bacterium]|jgi:CheY-like chemotaxis protein|nr:hybrid sensor histidine kinase/response regulator [Desulfococcaceae bacterium]
MQEKEKILIVDDERFNINVLVAILKEDYRLLIAKNGEEALKRVRFFQPPDIILLDIMMPGMDGYEVCRRLKSDPETRHIPVIFITAMSEMENEEKGLRMGAIDYITKPVSPPIVRARVRNHLNLKLAMEKISGQKVKIEEQNRELKQAARFRENVERITRHDVKTPLNSIIGFSQLLVNDENLTEEQQECLSTIEDSAFRILNIINLSVDLFRMEQKTYPLHPVPVNLLHVIEKIKIESGGLMRGKELHLQILIQGKKAGPKDFFYAEGEELLFYSMLANLIKNALEASPDRETVTVSLEKNEEKEQVLISIHNVGSVPEEIRDSFFEIYVTSGKKEGTGLGTYSARLIAETLRGSISMTTSEAQGTTLSIRVPATE